VLEPVKVGPRPRSVAFTPDGGRAYVPSENGGTLTVIDTKRLAAVRTITLGDGVRPMGTAMSADGILYVSTGRTKMVYVVDTKTDKVTTSVEVGQWPWGIGLSPDGKHVFTANGPSNDISVVDTATGQVTRTISAGRGPWGIAVVANP
jgi:YVTN family beta-propeller protein